MRAAAFVLLLALLPLAQGLTSAPEPTLPAALPCEGYADRPGLGPSCPVEGGYELTLPDGHVLFTHGLDPVPTLLAPVAFPAGPKPPACVEPAVGQRHHLVIYARPADRLDRGDAFRDELRRMVQLANGLLDREARERGAAGMDYRMACTDGEIRIDSVVLPYPSAPGGDHTVSYYRVVAAIRALGYDDPLAKYWIWYDDPWGCPCGGVADATHDQLRAPNNGANGGGNYAVTFGHHGDTGAFILMHENGHNMGAVSAYAPASSGAAHCNDGWDVMCYADGGRFSKYDPYVCTDRLYFDCQNNTYFDARPNATEYLTKKWNIAGPLNRYVQGCLHEQLLLTAGSAAIVDIPPACVGGRFAAFGEPTTPVYMGLTIYASADANKVDVCWYAGDALLRCDASRYFEEGEVPAGATRALVTKTDGPDPRVLLSIV